MPTETKEEFLARYPKPSPIRALVRCHCDYEGCTGWAWSYLPISHYEELEDE